MDEISGNMQEAGFGLVSIERLIIRALQRLAIALHSLSQTLEDISFSDRCSTFTNSIFSRLYASYDVLPDSTQHLILIVLSFLCLLTFVFMMPILFGVLTGTDPSLDTIPAPSLTFFANDDVQSDVFPDADVLPQLCPPSETSLDCISPLNGTSLGHVAQDTPESVRCKTALARKVQPVWNETSFAQRKKLLRVLRDYILGHQAMLCGLSRFDTGKTLLDANMGELLTTLEKIRWLLAEGEDALRPSRRSTGPMAVHKIAEVTYSPLGVIGAIAPWNYPLHNMFNPVLAALFSGNAIIVKPSEHTAYASLHFARIVRRALSLCGHDPDLMQIAIGGADVGRAMISAGIDKLFFTGSTTVGRMVATAAAEKLLPTVLELGGKDAFIVCADANVNHAASLCLRGVFQNAGQNCVGVERVFVHRNIKTIFMKLVLDVVKKIRVDEDVGAMTMGLQAINTMQALVAEATSMGATVLYGGCRTRKESGGYFYAPTVLDGVTPNMRIAKEEVFGPIMALYDWESETELVGMVNECKFGLGMSVFTGDKQRARRIADAVKVGIVNVNDFGINYLCQSMPFGGNKDSGSDRFAGIEGLRGCCLAKSTTRDRFPGIRTNLPRNFAYPVTKNAFALAAEINNLVYLPGVMSKIDALRNVVITLCTREWMPREIKADIHPYE